MRKTDEYYQSKEVCNNAKDYHNIDVMVAQTYVRAYDEAINYTNGYKVQIELLKEIFNLTAGAWDDPVISEDLYNRMETAISFNVS